MQSLIEAYTTAAPSELSGSRGVNVLELNLTLDERYPQP